MLSQLVYQRDEWVRGLAAAAAAAAVRVGWSMGFRCWRGD